MTRFSPALTAFAWCVVHFLSGTPQQLADLALDSVLKKMDTVAASFRNTQAQFEWETYEKVIDEIDDYEKGTIYYRRNGNAVEMMAEIKLVGSDPASLKPEPKYVLFSDGKVRLYQPKLDQETVYDLGKNRADFESYVVLGFGGSGQDLLKTFDVTYVGPETVNGVATAKLQLVPKSEKVRNTYKQILLWIDLDRGISVQQKFISPQEDYRLAKYSDVKVNEKKMGDDIFKLKTTNKTQTISPHG